MSNQNFSTEDINDSIVNYLNIITDSTLLVTLFEQGNCFAYDSSLLTTSTISVHAYPGIFEGQLYFFMIPAEYDNKDSFIDGSMAANTQGCLVFNSSKLSSSHRIPFYVAQARINNWQDHYTTWIPAEVSSSYGMFKAFDILTEDFESIDDIVFLGLEEDKDVTSGYVPDLVIANPNNASAVVVFDDFVEPVPPFNSTEQMESFYILSR